MRSARSAVLHLQPMHRLFSVATRLHTTPSFGSGPAPPRLPKKDQELYEELQRTSTGAFSTPKPTVIVNQPAASSRSDIPERQGRNVDQSPHPERASEPSTEQKLEIIDAKVQARGNGEELHPDIRRGTKPEFDGDRNPRTGETGGPKNEPLRWGGEVDWSYNGRVTDF